MYEYVNAWKNIRFDCAGIRQPGSTEEVVALVNEAQSGWVEAQAGRRAT